MPVEISDREIPCLLVFDRNREKIEKLNRKDPLPLLSIGNRHLIEHQLEWLNDHGFKTVRISIADRQRETEQFVDDGARWGTRITYSTDPEFLDLKSLLQKHPSDEKGTLLVDGHAVIKCDFPESFDGSTLFFTEERQLPLMYLLPDDYEAVQELGANDVDELCRLAADAFPHFKRHTVAEDHFCHVIRDVQAFIDMDKAIQEKPDFFHFKGSTPSPGIQLGRMTSVAPTAKLQPPVLIGDGAFVKQGAEIGPGAFIGDHSFVERGAHIVNTVVAPGTYIGKNTTFENKYICRNYVLDLETETSIFIDDPLILGDLRKTVLWARGLERVVALILFLMLLGPIILLLPLHRILRGCWLVSERILEQPVRKNLRGEYDFHWYQWHRFRFGLFFFDVMPGLLDVARGKLSFVGNPPITEEELNGMDEIFQEERLRGKAGCTGLVQHLDPKTTTADEIFTTSIFYNATRTLKGDVLLFMRALIPGIHRDIRDTK